MASSIVALKAELERKKAEAKSQSPAEWQTCLAAKKLQRKEAIYATASKPSPGETGSAEKKFDEEDQKELAASRLQLEKKAKLYEKLTNASDVNDLKDVYLVDFERKSLSELKKRPLRPPPPEFPVEEVEEKQEEGEPMGPVHYQNVLHREIRSHGVGYYGFSTDEEARAAEQEALKTLRRDTQVEQKKKIERRAEKRKMMKERIKKVWEKKRLRAGLPLKESASEGDEKDAEEEEIEEKEEKEEPELDVEEAKDPSPLIKEKPPVRPWDADKNPFIQFRKSTEKDWSEDRREKKPPNVRKPRENPWFDGRSEERSAALRNARENTWLEERRGERPTEFAPPTKY
ncbi:unnamed protein product [Darwinula stevensoni]|uniref:Coiled-coil domain-containing protein 174 n=1 Tax=Darwinula stevensoni TaxID=69355 RepID=A0A7R9AFL3_9CRUS|nr:unnamed protein product [Darwinula stevensoni]CAG0903417.1 unnamed protein product [Darwinula stevensoni]